MPWVHQRSYLTWENIRRDTATGSVNNRYCAYGRLLGKAEDPTRFASKNRMKRLLQPGHLHANVDTQLVQSEALPFLSRPNHQRFFTLSKSSDMRDNPANSRPSCHLQRETPRFTWPWRDEEQSKHRICSSRHTRALSWRIWTSSQLHWNSFQICNEVTNKSLVPPPRSWELTETKIKCFLLNLTHPETSSPHGSPLLQIHLQSDQVLLRRGQNSCRNLWISPYIVSTSPGSLRGVKRAKEN